jgi:hypothetical protein
LWPAQLRAGKGTVDTVTDKEWIVPAVDRIVE